MGRPTVEHFNENIFLNFKVDLIDLFSYVDPDGDALMHLDISDYQPGERTGYLEIDGIAQENGGRFRILAKDLDKVKYVAGSVIGWEGFRVVATDVTGEFSTADNFGRLYTVRENVTRPIVQSRPFSALADELTAVSPFVVAWDSDGYPITQFYLRDTEIDNGSLVFDGVAVAQREFILVQAEDMDKLFYETSGGATKENLEIFAYDGEDWSVRQLNEISTTPNVNRPVAQFTRGNVDSRELLPMGPLANVTDDDGNSIKWMEFWNTSPHDVHGELVFKGVVQPRKEWIRVQADEIDQLFFEAPNRDFVQQIRYRGFDGKFQSNNGTISITTNFVIPPTQPELGNPGLIYDQQLVEYRIDQLLPQIDSGKPYTTYQLLDANDFGQVSARFENNGNKLAPLTIHEFSDIEIRNNVRIKMGDYNNRSEDDMYVRARNEDGLWTTWERVQVRTEPEYIGAHDDNNDWADGVYNAIPRDAENRLVLSYSFMQDFPDYATGEATDPDPSDPPEYFSQLTQPARIAVRRAFDYFESIANVKYVEVSDRLPNVFGQRGGIFRFGNYGLDPDTAEAVAFTFTPSLAPQASDVWYNRVFMGQGFDTDFDGELDAWTDTDLTPGTFNYTVHLHELMHAHGYMHSYEDANGSAILPPDTNNANFSVLSIPGGPFRGDGLVPITPMLYDVETLQRDYGINPNFDSGDTLHSLATTFSERPDFSMTLWDGGGNDTLSLEGSNPAIGTGAPGLIDLSPGAFSSFNGFDRNVSIAFRAVIENATGSEFDDTLLGNQFDNVIRGGLGDDVLEGRVGNDTLTGGRGDDLFLFGVGDDNDIINEERGAGRDTLRIKDFGQPDQPGGVNSLEDDFTFEMQGRDLVINLRLDNSDLSDGSVQIVNHQWGGSRIETLEFNGTRIDLRNLSDQITATTDKFRISTEPESVFGNLVVPI